MARAGRPLGDIDPMRLYWRLRRLRDLIGRFDYLARRRASRLAAGPEPAFATPGVEPAETPRPPATLRLPAPTPPRLRALELSG